MEWDTEPKGSQYFGLHKYLYTSNQLTVYKLHMLLLLYKLQVMPSSPTSRMSDLVKGGRNLFSSNFLQEVKAEMRIEQRCW